MGFKKLEENMNYSANRLLQVFPKYFDRFTANTFARKPKDIANIVYGGRMGNVEPNDGWDFRGRGYIHLTGRRNYELFGDSIGVDLTDNPQLVSKNYPMDSAAWFWVTNKIDELSDNGSVAQITRRVNGGVNGLKEREALFRKYLSLIK
jgi:putative chitinase